MKKKKEKNPIAGAQEMNAKRREIIDFADEHKLVINPGAGYDYYVDNFFMLNSCACDSKRKNCPCPEAVKECKQQGWCKCRLYWRDLATFAANSLPKEDKK